MLQEYEFLDLTDVKEADRSSLQCALFKTLPEQQKSAKIVAVQPSVGKYFELAKFKLEWFR